MTLSYRLTERADADLVGIYRYTAETWSHEQALDYHQGLQKLFHDIADHPLLGPIRQDLQSGLRARLYKRHVVFYEIQDNTVTILRILHERQDPRRAGNLR